jgi:hypothetical protein
MPMKRQPLRGKIVNDTFIPKAKPKVKLTKLSKSTIARKRAKLIAELKRVAEKKKK